MPAWTDARPAAADENGDLLAPAVARKVRFRVTPEALLVFQAECRGGYPQGEDRGGGEEPTLPMTTLKEPGVG